MAGLAMVSLVMLRSMVKSIPAPETNVVLSLPSAAGDQGGDADAYDEEPAAATARATSAEPGARRETVPARRAAPRQAAAKLRLKKGPSLKDDLYGNGSRGSRCGGGDLANVD